MVNIVGDQASYHRPFDPPLTADTEGLARAVSHWVRTSRSAQQVAFDGAEAVQAARTPPGEIATLIVPADVAWSEASGPAVPRAVSPRPQVEAEVLRTVARVLRSGKPTLLFLNGQALCEALSPHTRLLTLPVQASAPASAAHERAVAGGFRGPRSIRGRYGLPGVGRLKHVILVGAKPLAGFFAYPGKPSLVIPQDCATHVLARPDQDAVAALHGLSDEISAPRVVRIEGAGPKPCIASGPFESEAFGMTLAALLPENAIVAEDAVTSGRAFFPATFNAAPHDWIQNTGGAIGHGFPCATGAAVACPDRKVVCLQADGAGMFTLQALWTQARENLDVVNVVFANRMYKILYASCAQVRCPDAPQRLLRLGRPTSAGWTAKAWAWSSQCETLEGFADAFRAACSRRGPFLIEFQFK
jgi:acetolactate synthase-1/2/3 large subunit